MPKRNTSVELESRAAQLSSLLALLYGDGFKHFEALNSRHQDNILWLAADLARAISDEIDGKEVNHA